MDFLQTIDWIVIILYFLVIAGISAWSMKKKKDSTQEYFLANRNELSLKTGIEEYIIRCPDRKFKCYQRDQCVWSCTLADLQIVMQRLLTTRYFIF
jgi:hypothetical protein